MKIKEQNNYLFGILFIFFVLTVGLFSPNKASAAYKISYDGQSFTVDSLQTTVEWNSLGDQSPDSGVRPYFKFNGTIKQYDYNNPLYGVSGMTTSYLVSAPSLDLNTQVVNLSVGENTFEFYSDNYHHDTCGCIYGDYIPDTNTYGYNNVFKIYDYLKNHLSTPTACAAEGDQPSDGIYAKLIFAGGHNVVTNKTNWQGTNIRDVACYTGYVQTLPCGDDGGQCCFTQVSKKIVVEEVAAPSTCKNLPTVGATAYTAPDNAGLTADTSYSHSDTDTATKCQYKCSDGYTWQSHQNFWGNTVYSCAVAPITCKNLPTVGATAYTAPDNTGLTADTNYAHSDTDTATKCQYKCSDGYSWQSHQTFWGNTVYSCAVAPINCTLPWGGTLASGSSVTAYSASSVACGSLCSGISETRTCTNGTLSGSYTNQSCSVAACPTGTWTAPTCPTVCSTAASNPSYTCVGGNGACSTNTPATRSCAATAACPCAAPLTKNVTVACDVNATGVAATSGSVTRSQTKSAYPACTFGTPVTTANSTYVSDSCVYPPPVAVSCGTNAKTYTTETAWPSQSAFCSSGGPTKMIPAGCSGSCYDWDIEEPVDCSNFSSSYACRNAEGNWSGGASVVAAPNPTFPAAGSSTNWNCGSSLPLTSCSASKVVSVCSTPLTQTVTVACDVNATGVAATSGSVTRSQTKSAYPACTFGTPVTTANSTYVSDNCVYPPPVCTAPLTQNVTVACDKNADGYDAVSGLVSRRQTKSAYPACTFGTPVTVANSTYVSDNCRYPSCPNGALVSSYPSCNVCPADKVYSGGSCVEKPTCTTLSVSKSDIKTGDMVALTWVCQHAASCSAVSNGDGFSTGGSLSGTDSSVKPSTPSGPVTYGLTCDSTSFNFPTVTVHSPSVHISANPTRVKAGTSSKISWVTSDVQSCTVTGGNGFSKTGTSGTGIDSGLVNSQTVFTASCATTVGPVTDSVTVNVTASFKEF